MRYGRALASVSLLLMVGGGVVAQDVSRADAELAMSQFRSGQRALEEGRSEDAVRFFQEALRDDPAFTAAHCALGQTYFARREYGAAAESLSACKAQTLARNEKARADAFERDRQRDDELRELRDSLRRIESGAVQLAAKHATQVRIENRIRELEDERFRDKQAASVPAETLFALGTALLRTGALDAAERELLEAVRTDPGHGEARNNLAAIYVAKGRWDAAEEQARLAEAAGFGVSAQLWADIRARHASVSLERAPVEQPQARPPARGPGDSGEIRIEHEPIACVLADAFPTISARFEGEDVGRAEVRFRGAGEEQWYSVLMFPDRQGVYPAVLPKPKSSLTGFSYVVQATDPALRTSSTEEHSVAVLKQGQPCPSGLLAALAVSPPLITLGVPEGSRSGPEGFSGKNVLASYPSGKVVKGHPSTALLAVAGAGAVTAGLALLKNEPVGSPVPSPTSAYVRLAGSNPGPGSTISLSRGSLSLTFDVYPPVTLPAGGEVTAVLHEGLADSSRGCVTLSGTYGGEVPAFSARQVSVNGPFVAVDASCGASFQVSRARVTFQAFGSVYFQTRQTPEGLGGGTGLLDVPVDYRFEP